MHRVTEELLSDITTTAGAAEISVMRRLLGLPVRGQAGERIDRELAKRGLLPSNGPVPAPEPAAPTDAPPVDPTRQGAT